MLAARNIVRTIGEESILSDVDASVHAGELTAVIGPSGSGKSTLLRVLALVEHAQGGVVSLDGQDYRFPASRDFPQPRPWPRVSMVFQQLFLWPHLSLRQNISLVTRRCHGSSPVSDEEVLEIAARLDLLELLDRHPNEVSFGQRQRAALARALATRPSYLLLDEVTSAQDVERVRHLLHFLEDLCGKGTGLMVATHLIGFARDAASTIVFLDQGEVVESGSPEILSHPKTERLAHFLSLMVA